MAGARQSLADQLENVSLERLGSSQGEPEENNDKGRIF